MNRRQPELTEEMDREDCDLQKLHNTYRQFHIVNKLISKWHMVYRKEIHPILKTRNNSTLLDIGFGGGDITAGIEKWANKDNHALQITAADPDGRAHDFARSHYPTSNINWLQCSSTDLLETQNTYDIVISNHVIHHLSDNELLNLLYETEQLVIKKAVFADIERNLAGYVLFNIFSRLFFHRSFITKDGLTSIKRSFTYSELKGLVPEGWKVKKAFPFRLLLIYENQ